MEDFGRTRVCSVLFLDIVEYSRRDVAEQVRLKNMFNLVMSSALGHVEPEERVKPEIIKASRKRRIASGAGVPVQAVNQLLNQFEQMQKMMKMMKGGNLQRMMRGMKGMLPGMR